MVNAPPRLAGIPTPAEVARLGKLEAARQAALLRMPEQSLEAAGRPIADPQPRLVPPATRAA